MNIQRRVNIFGKTSSYMKFFRFSFFLMLSSILNGASQSDLTFIWDHTNYLCGITDCSSLASGELDIPQTIFNYSTSSYYTVVTIEDNAFSSCYWLTKIVVPSSVYKIGNNAFSYCDDLQVVEFKGNKPSIVGYLIFGITSSNSYPYVLVSNSTTGWSSTFGGQKVLSEYSNIDPYAYYNLGIDSVISDPSAYDLVSKSNYDSVITERDARPTQAAYDALVAENSEKYNLKDIADLRAGSKMIEILNGQANLSMDIERSDELGSWTIEGNLSTTIPIQAGEDKKFFRFKMNDSDSSLQGINFSIGDNEYDEAAIIEALAEQYGVPSSSISLTVTGG